MNYRWVMWENGERVKEEIVSAGVLLERIARVAVYLQCENVKDFYAFRMVHDELYRFLRYEIDMHNEKTGVHVRHIYYPIENTTMRV